METLSMDVPLCDDRGEKGFELIRIYLGVGLIIKGFFFLTHREYLVNLIMGSGNLWAIPVLIAHYVILAHIVGGLLLGLGLLTRPAALAQIPALLGAVFYIHLPLLATVEGRQNVEFSALVLFLLVLMVYRGGGVYSVDYKMEKKKLPNHNDT